MTHIYKIKTIREDEDFGGEEKIKDGSTYIRKLLIANCGDSRSVLCSSGAASKPEGRRKGRKNKKKQKKFFSSPFPFSFLPFLVFLVVPLTTDHNPCEPQEKCRIRNAGWSIRDERISGLLSVSRSFGDFNYKLVCFWNIYLRIFPTQKINFS